MGFEMMIFFGFGFAGLRSSEWHLSKTLRVSMHIVLCGQIEGSDTMKRMSNFQHCVLTWKAHDKNIFEEMLDIV